MRTIYFRLGLICVSGFLVWLRPKHFGHGLDGSRDSGVVDGQIVLPILALGHHHPNRMKLLPNRRGASL